MKLMDVTNENRLLVQNQLDNTDATFVKVFTYGTTTIILTKAQKHIEILYRNKKRDIKTTEIEETLPNLINVDTLTREQIEPLRVNGYVELSIPR